MIKIKLLNTDIGFKQKKGKNILLKDINISADSGELIALIGVNGSGKSTLLRSLIGLQNLLSGSVEINGVDKNEYSKIDLAKKIAFVSSELINTKYLKVEDLVSLGRYPYQTLSDQNSKKDKEIIEAVLKTVGMTDFKDRLITEISDGERQKVMTARALAQDTDIILLDEPAAFLDLANKFGLYKILSETVQQLNKTIIFSTHDLNIALKYCDKVWLINNEKIYEGSPEDLYLTGMFRNIFSEKHVVFNSETFEFSVKFDKKIPVKIIDNSKSPILKHITINALRRKGFFNSVAGVMKIIINKENWEIIQNKGRFTVKTISELLKIISEMKK